MERIVIVSANNTKNKIAFHINISHSHKRIKSGKKDSKILYAEQGTILIISREVHNFNKNSPLNLFIVQIIRTESVRATNVSTFYNVIAQDGADPWVYKLVA
jgi:hypothetical protein